ncbi:MAG: radical SAM family heme chaperone HemW [Oscillospiraceae bacterium]|nr:radical SAM family heme chaperone HemW [Oscillospiraceae bacterium]
MCVGVYIHIPFCRGKCPYCDFYSCVHKNLEHSYVEALNNRLLKTCGIKADTLYIGGGTPSMLEPCALSSVINTAKKAFCIEEKAEITVECNPSDDLKKLIPEAVKSGVNRISLGLQSAVDEERKSLSRRANCEDVKQAVEIIKKIGVYNISLDLMLGIPGQTADSLKRSIEFCAEAEAKHVSAYILKIEENTHFYKVQDTLKLPNEDQTCELYLKTCELLDSYGYRQYEISNFAKPGYESSHNLKYWNAEEYIGFGPSAHSFFKGRRSYYESDTDSFISGKDSIDDGPGGDMQEYMMLRLRLSEGIKNSLFYKRFGTDIPRGVILKAKELQPGGLVVTDGGSVRLTRNGFLLSNSVISHILN